MDPGMPGGEAALRRLFDHLAAGTLPDAPAALAQKESSKCCALRSSSGAP